MKFLKIGCFCFLLIVLLPVILVELYSHYQLDQLGIEKPVNFQPHSVEAKDILWVSLGEREAPEEKLYSFSVTTSIAMLLKTVLLYESNNHAPYYKNFPSGFFVSNRVARVLMADKRSRSGDWHFNNLIVSSWVSRNYTKDEALSYLLSTLYVGYESYGLRNASKVYFNKEHQDLTVSEVLSLVEIARAPSRYKYCEKIEELESRSVVLLNRLKEYSSSKYSHVLYQQPDFVNCELEKVF